MPLTEQIALFLTENGFPAFSAALPSLPDRAVAVLASDLRPEADAEGSRFELLVRSERDKDSALEDCCKLISLLLNCPLALSVGGSLILRAELENGGAFLGLDEHRRARYSLNFRVWHC